jgi:cytochrome bd-type quinol oxidase subunit 2
MEKEKTERMEVSSLTWKELWTYVLYADSFALVFVLGYAAGMFLP